MTTPVQNIIQPILLSAAQRGALYAILSGLCYGFLGYFGVHIMKEGLSPSNMLFWRFFVSFLLVLPFSIRHYKIFLSKNGLKIFFSGMIFYSLSSVFYFRASQYIGTGLGMVILFTFPAMVLLINRVLYKTTINKIYYMAFLMIIVGMLFLIDLHELSFDIFGIQLGILSALCYAGYIIACKKTPIEPVPSTLMVSAGCMTTCLIISCISSNFYVPTGIAVWSNIIGIASLCTAIPVLLLLQGLKYISAEKASMLSVLEPVFVFLFGILLLGEEVSAFQVFGTLIILSGAFMTLTKNTH